MKNISSKKLVTAIIISSISLQLIPFNLFADNSLSSTAKTLNSSTVYKATSLSDNSILLRGKFISSNPNKVLINFDVNNEEILLNIAHTMANPDFKNEVYMCVNLFSKSGKLKNFFELKGTDYPEINESIKNFNHQKFEYGDYLTIYHKEPEKMFLYAVKL